MVDLALIVGLGNPGDSYRDTRHNAGFWFVEELLKLYPITLKYDNRFKGKFGIANIANIPVRVFMPDSFINESGMPISKMANYFSISPSEILIVHDDLDLSPGDIKLKVGGGHGGHNGLRDIHRHLSSTDYLRLKIGIGHPGHSDLGTQWVLGKPAKKDLECIKYSIQRGLAEIKSIVGGNVEQAMNTLHTNNGANNSCL